MEPTCSKHQHYHEDCDGCCAMKMLFEAEVIWTQPLPFYGRSADFSAIEAAIKSRLERHDSDGKHHYNGSERRLERELATVIRVALKLEEENSEEFTPFLGWSGDYSTLVSVVEEAGGETSEPLLKRLQAAQASAQSFERFQSQRAGELKRERGAAASNSGDTEPDAHTSL